MWIRLKKSFIVNVLLVALLVGAGIQAARMIRQALIAREEYRSVEKQIEELTRKKNELEAYLAELETPEAREREAKARLNLKKQGEKVVVVVPEKKEELNELHEFRHSWWVALLEFLRLY